MKAHYKRILLPTSLLLIVLFLFAKVPARAASQNNLVFATIQYVQDAISTALSPIQTSIQGLSNRTTNLEATVTPIPSEISDLQKRVSALETQIPSPTPTPETFTFFNGAISTSGQASPVADTQGYSKIAVSFQCTVGSVAVNIQDSPDQTTWFTQERWDPSYCPGGVTTQLVLANRYYRLITDSTTLPSVSLNATGYIFHQ